MLPKLETIDPSLLLNVVRQDQRSQEFEIRSWSVSKLSEQGMINPDGLFLFRGSGQDQQGTRPWSVVLKIIRDRGFGSDPSFNWYWKREALAYASGLLNDLPGPLRAARGYGVQEFEGEAWLWIEHLVDRLDGHWGLAQHVFAAEQLGQFNGAFLNGAPQPDFPWLNRGQSRDWVKFWAPEEFSDQPGMLQVFSERQLEQFHQLWAEREQFLGILDSLPAAFSHYDFKRRNLFLVQSASGADEIAAIDWAECGVGALGRDLAYVVGTNCFFREYPSTALAELDARAFEAYLAGLRQTGWQGSEKDVRLGYAAWLALKFGTIMPRMVGGALATEEARLKAATDNQMSMDELIVFWRHLGDFILDRYVEARALAERAR
jgi:hypothetical protein